MTFHPDKNMPGCMMPDGGECCAGYAAAREDWHKQRGEIERLRATLEMILIMHDGNQPLALDIPELDYARRTIRNIHAEARSSLALSSQNGASK